jgi:two-component system chemotaxis response regulator CheB
LIIDDSLTIRGILDTLLSRYADLEIVGLASDVEHARQLIQDREPDVITLDLALSGIDGMDYLEELSHGPHAPVLVISSSTKDKSEKTRAAIKAGAFACFDKARLLEEAPRFLKVPRRAAEVRRRHAEQRRAA